MKHSLFFKLILIYLLVVVFTFTLLNTYGAYRIKEHFITEEVDELYENARYISSEYITAYYQDEITDSELFTIFEDLGKFESIDLWIVSREGSVMLNTTGISQGKVNLNSIDPDFLDSSCRRDVTLNGIFDSPRLSVIFPVTALSGSSLKGYLVVHSSMEEIEKTSIRYTDILNICLIIMLGLLLLVFIVLYFIFIHPLNKLIKAAKEYSNGNFDYQWKLHSHDGYRDLGNTMGYIVNKWKSSADYQTKIIANISHDFRSPLTSMKGYAEAMIDGTIPPELHAKYLDIILFETERLTKLTSNLLELNNFENRGAHLDIASFDINSVIKRTAASFEGACRKKRIILQLEFSSDESYVDADVAKIQQVLYNLLDNAIKFSHHDSSIYIATEEKNDKLFISVKDEGIGIPPDSIMKVWDRFYKTDLSRGKDKKGTGLGLSITKDIITAHGEQITVTSTEAVGTTFTFSLPLSDEE